MRLGRSFGTAVGSCGLLLGCVSCCPSLCPSIPIGGVISSFASVHAPRTLFLRQSLPPHTPPFIPLGVQASSPVSMRLARCFSLKMSLLPPYFREIRGVSWDKTKLLRDDLRKQAISLTENRPPAPGMRLWRELHHRGRWSLSRYSPRRSARIHAAPAIAKVSAVSLQFV